MTPRHRAPLRALLELSAAGPRRRAAAALVAAALAAVALLSGAAPAAAHNTLTGSTPADGSTVTEPVAEVVLEFDQAVQAEFAQVAVLGPDQTPYHSGDPVVVGRTATQAVAPLPAGVYTVSYRVISADGHPVSGTLTFTAAAQAPAAAEPAAEPEDTAEPEPTGTRAPADASPTPEPVETSDASPQAAVGDDDGALSTPALVGIAIAVAAGVAGAAYAAVRRRPGDSSDSGKADTRR